MWRTVSSIGVRDEFCSWGGGGGRGWSLMPKYFLNCLPENQMVLPEYYRLFCPKMAIWKIRGGGYSPMGLTPIISRVAIARVEGWKISTATQLFLFFLVNPMIHEPETKPLPVLPAGGFHLEKLYPAIYGIVSLRYCNCAMFMHNRNKNDSLPVTPVGYSRPKCIPIFPSSS